MNPLFFFCECSPISTQTSKSERTRSKSNPGINSPYERWKQIKLPAQSSSESQSPCPWLHGAVGVQPVYPSLITGTQHISTAICFFLVVGKLKKNNELEGTFSVKNFRNHKISNKKDEKIKFLTG